MNLIGKKAPALEFLHWFNSRPLTAADLRGRVLLLDFWSTSCQPCIRNIPNVARIEERLGHRGLIVVLAHMRESAHMVTRSVYGQEFRTSEDVPAEQVLPKFITEHKISSRVAVTEDRIFDAFGAPAVPFYVVIDRSGVVRYQGVQHPDESFVAALLSH